MNLRRNQRGQAFVLTVLFLMALVGFATLVVDLGAWFRQHRQLQATADASALAGAQELPSNPGLANAFATQYANRNTAGLQGVNITFSTTFDANDTIRVHVDKPAPGFFARIFGVSSVNLGANAVARTSGMQAAKYVAPIVVKETHPMLTGEGCGSSSGPCFGLGNRTTIPVSDTGAPGAFSLLNLNQDPQGTGSASEVAEWIENGYQEYLPLGGYYSSPGVKFNAHQVQSALGDRYGDVLLFPVYDTLTGSGANAQYHIIAWAAFHVESSETHGNEGSITGYFTEIIWEGLQASTPGGGGPNFGARTVQLVE
jgi:Putative Flp pilus-assembly TadE/G-like